MSGTPTSVRAVIVLLLTGIFAASCGGAPQANEPAGSPVPATNAVVVPLLPTDAIAMPDATPETYSELLTQLHGTPVIVNIWGSWCAPCEREAPLLADAAQRYGGQIQFVGVDIMDTKTSAREFIQRYGWTYPTLFDPSPSGAIRSSLGYLGQPVTIFYDAEGTQVSDWEGALSEEILDERIQQLLPVPMASSPPPSQGS